MTVPYRPLKPSIIDRLSARLFPTLALMDPQEGQAVGRQGLLQLGANLLQAGGASPQQQGTLANIGRAIGGVNLDELQQRAMALQQYRQQQQAQRQFGEIAEQYGPKEGDSPEQIYKSIASMIPRLLAVPGGTAYIGPLSNVLAQVKPARADRGIVRFGVPPGSPPGTPGQLYRIYADNTVEPLGIEQGLTPYQMQALGFQEQAAARPGDTERTSAALGANMAASHIGMRGIEQQNPQSIGEISAIVRGGRVLGSLPIVGPTLDEAIRAGKAPVLSPEARQFLAHFNSFVAAAVPERGGKTLTFTELKLFMDEFVPDPGDDPETARVKLGNRIKRIRESKIKGGRAWNDALNVFGLTEDQIFGVPTKPTHAPHGAPSWRDLDPDRKP